MSNKIGFNPWLTMWIKPKETIRRIVDFNPNYRLLVLSAIYGFVSLISSAQSFALGNLLNTYLIILICLILSPVWGYIMFSLSSFFIYFTGKWLKGRSPYNHIRSAVAWSNIPMIANVIIWIVLFFMFKEELLKEFPQNYLLTGFQKNFLFLILFCQLIFSIWVLVLYVNSLAEVQRFSIGKAILNIIIAVVIAVAIFFVVSIVYSLILRGFNR